MPITGIDIRKTYFYQEVQRLNREDDLRESLGKVAINLLKKGMTIEFICECTGLSIETVKELSKNIK